MNELRRQAYLEAMGIESYVPRAVLPGALPSSLCELPSITEQQVAAETTGLQGAEPSIVSQTFARGHAAAVQALFEDTDSPQVVNKAGSNMAELNKLKPAAPAIPRFSLSTVVTSNILLLDDGLAGHINPKEYQQLLQNILYAVVGHQALIKLETFNWPMTRNSQHDQSEEAARQALHSLIAKRTAQMDADSYVLVMGDNAGYYLSSEEVLAGQITTIKALASPILRTVSAVAMLDNPLLKRRAWIDLQPLVRVFGPS